MYQQWIGMGNLGNDPEARYTPGGKMVCSFRLAINTRKDKTLWVRISTWEKQAELVSKYLTKGSKVMVIGEVEEPNAYTNKAGEPAANLEVTARLVKFIGGTSNGQVPAEHVADPSARQEDEMIPF